MGGCHGAREARREAEGRRERKSELTFDLLLLLFPPPLFLSNKSRTLGFENRKNIACIALSPDGNVLLSVDEGESPVSSIERRAQNETNELTLVLLLLLPLPQTVEPSSPLSDEELLFTTSTSRLQSSLSSSPRTESELLKASLRELPSFVELTFRVHPFRFFAVTHKSHLQIWQTPSHLAREFAPFVLHRNYTGHRDEVTSITWSPCSR